jgi:hypothetical protein
VRVHGQSVIVSVVASETVYVIPFWVTWVAYGQYVVKAVTTTVVYEMVPFQEARAPVAAARRAKLYFILNEMKGLTNVGSQED